MAGKPMGVVSGKDGSVWIGGQPVGPVLWWELVRRCSSKAYVANDTAGWRRRLPGAKEGAGRFEMKLRTDQPMSLRDGQQVSLQLHLDGTGQNYYELPALIQRIANRVHIATGEVVGYLVDFVAAGPVVGHGIVGEKSH